MAFWDAASRAIRGGYAQVNPWDNNRTWDTTQKGLAPGYRQASTPKAPDVVINTGQHNTPDTGASIDAQIAALQAQNRAFSAQLAAQPRLPYYNSSAGWATAQKAAQGVVDPVYTDKLNQYLQKEQLGIKQNTEQQQQQEQDIQTALKNALLDIGTNRTRTTEDMATHLGDVGTAENNYQTNEGRQFGAARDALLGSVANAGLTTSGIGQGKVQEQITDRNIASGQQSQSFESARRDIHTAASRTFEDLATNEGRQQEVAKHDTTVSKKALQDYIDNAALDEQGFRTQNEAERLAAIAGETNNQYQLGVRSFIQSLIGSGARSQDIALAQQVYGA